MATNILMWREYLVVDIEDRVWWVFGMQQKNSNPSPPVANKKYKLSTLTYPSLVQLTQEISN
jgi:hypothetical protein